MKKFFKTSGWILLYLSIYFTLQVSYIMVATLVLSIIVAIQNPGSTPAAMTQKIEPLIAGQTTVAIIVSSIMAFGLYYLIIKAKKQDFYKVCQFNKIPWKDALIFVPAGAGLVFINGFLLSFLTKTEVMDQAFSKHADLMEQLLGGNGFIVFLSVAVAAPFIEEIIFRGLVLKELRKNVSVKWAIIIQALLFALYHMQVIQGIYTFFMGILLGVVCVWLKSIWPAIILHVFNNLTSVVISRMTNYELLETLEIPIIIVSVIVVVGVTIYAYKNRVIEVEEVMDSQTSLQ